MSNIGFSELLCERILNLLFGFDITIHVPQRPLCLISKGLNCNTSIQCIYQYFVKESIYHCLESQLTCLLLQHSAGLNCFPLQAMLSWHNTDQENVKTMFSLSEKAFVRFGFGSILRTTLSSIGRRPLLTSSESRVPESFIKPVSLSWISVKPMQVLALIHRWLWSGYPPFQKKKNTLSAKVKGLPLMLLSF